MPTLSSAAPNPTLPFVLPGGLDAPPSDIPIVIDRLDALHGLVEATRSEVRELKDLNAELLRLARTPTPEGKPPATPGIAPAATSEPPELEFRLLGEFQVLAGSGPVEGWRSRKARRLLAYLAMDPNRQVPRETLIEQFWPDSAPDRSANNLSIAVHHIRRRLKSVVEGRGHGLRVELGMYGLAPELRCSVDVVEFQKRIEEARSAFGAGRDEQARAHLEAALNSYRGDFLESEPDAEWAIEPRRTLSYEFEWAIATLGRIAEAGGDWEALCAYGKTLVERDPCNEEGYRYLIRSYGQLGQRSQALKQYELCAEQLDRELGVEPSEETRAVLLEVPGVETG